jgi:hypothetical protein
MLLSVRRLFAEIWCVVFLGRPLWREVGSVIGFLCLVIAIIYINYLRYMCYWRSEVWGHVTTNDQSVSMSWCQTHLGTWDQILILSEFRCVVFVGALSDESLAFWGHVTTDGQSVSMSWRRAHFGTCDQILILSEFRCVVFIGRPLWREVGSVSCQSLSAIIVHCQFPPPFYTSYIRYIYTIYYIYIYTIYARPSQPRLSTADHAPSFVASTTTAI